MGTAILIVLAFLVGNGLFAGAEIAILSVRKTRLREFIRRKEVWGQYLRAGLVALPPGDGRLLVRALRKAGE